MKKIVLLSGVIALLSLLSGCEVIFPDGYHDRDNDRYDHRQHDGKKRHHKNKNDRYDDDDDDDDDRHQHCPPGQAKKGRC